MPKQNPADVIAASGKQPPISDKVALAVGCIAVLLVCSGLLSGCYMLCNTDFLGDAMIAQDNRERAERMQRQNDAIAEIDEDASLSDDEAVSRMARVIFDGEDGFQYELESATVVSDPGEPMTARVVVLQEFEMEARRFEAEGEKPMLAEGMANLTVSAAITHAARLAAVAEQRGLRSIEVLVRSRVTVGGQKEDIEVFEFAIPPEHFDTFVESLGHRAAKARLGFLDKEDMEGIWTVHQDNFDQITITVRRQ